MRPCWPRSPRPARDPDDVESRYRGLVDVNDVEDDDDDLAGRDISFIHRFVSDKEWMHLRTIVR